MKGGEKGRLRTEIKEGSGRASEEVKKRKEGSGRDRGEERRER